MTSGVWHNGGGPQHRVPDWGCGGERPVGQDMEASDSRSRADEELQHLELRLSRILDSCAPPNASCARQKRAIDGEERVGVADKREQGISVSRSPPPWIQHDNDVGAEDDDGRDSRGNEQQSL